MHGVPFDCEIDGRNDPKSGTMAYRKPQGVEKLKTILKEIDQEKDKFAPILRNLSSTFMFYRSNNNQLKELQALRDNLMDQNFSSLSDTKESKDVQAQKSYDTKYQ